MDESLIFADIEESKEPQTLREKLAVISFSHFNLILTAIRGIYIWMRGSSQSYSMEAFAIAASLVTLSWLIQLILALTSRHDKP